MTERMRDESKNWVLIIFVVATFGLTVAEKVFGAGGIFGGNQATVANFQSQLSDLNSKFDRLSQKIDTGPRPDQIDDIRRHLSALDGRMDAADRDQGEVKNRVTRVETLQGGIEAASRAKLPGQR